ncbi:pyrroline-5-carboxylate reductase [Chitinivorax tropicus]|uniref:Pyrroline-5-carboxylate reductase n=1 Tax=Chitinivorax tropicus TaxID=714531 RepID=A0A840ML75_9PROT|nr:pyrroline-5-carboxylate reductase [Chitinivorax tropicus]MBB5017462.1 pyrroline-5-carboxylate reductase [Chitinivorax tropicus]
MNITFIGGGNMATALIGGMLQQGFAAAGLTVVEPDPAKRDALQQQFGVQTQAAIETGLPACDVILIAVKPQSMKAVAQQLAPHLGKQLIISIAAGIQVNTLATWLGGYTQIVRVMPNTPALVRAGMSGLYAPPDVDTGHRAQAEQIMRAVGQVLWVAQETQIDAITAMSGSGPAYVFYFMEAMMAAGRALGFNDDDARKLTYATFEGAIKLALDSPDDAATLRAKVTSKGGTTEAALHAMEAAGVKQGIDKGIAAANHRGQELGAILGQQ